MALDKVLIGEKIREIRENVFEESRKEFANRCDLTERYIGQIERGEFLISLNSLDKISNATGILIDDILYDKGSNSKLKENLNNIIDKADKEEVKAIYKCITAIQCYMRKGK